MQANFKSVWTMSQAAAKHMIPKGSGKIISTASLMSFQVCLFVIPGIEMDHLQDTQGGIRVPAYAAAKGALNSLTKAMANEWAKHGINVNAIAPGYIKTDLNEALQNDAARSKEILSRIPAGRWGEPDDFKGPVVYLASRASDYVHGELSVVDGGWLGKCAY